MKRDEIRKKKMAVEETKGRKRIRFEKMKRKVRIKWQRVRNES